MIEGRVVWRECWEGGWEGCWGGFGGRRLRKSRKFSSLARALSAMQAGVGEYSSKVEFDERVFGSRYHETARPAPDAGACTC